jgi:hypothetical protein
MTLLIHFLMRLTTMFERGIVVDKTSANHQQLPDEIVHNNPERS